MAKRYNLAAERVRKGMTQKQLADELHVNVNSICRWELGQAEPKVSHLIALCGLFGCSPEYLMALE